VVFGRGDDRELLCDDVSAGWHPDETRGHRAPPRRRVPRWQ
jgi:hypothetical protein